MHGLANQPRLIPPGVKVNVEINLNKQSYCLMQHSNYQICKTTNADIEDITFPYPEDMQMVESSGTHETFAVCDCKAKLETNEYSRISEIFEKGRKRYADPEKCFEAADKFRAHTYYRQVPKLQTIRSPDNGEFIHFFAMRVQLNKDQLFTPDDVQFESVFKQPELKEEYPISTGVKNESAIPFYYPKFKRITIKSGKQEYEKELSMGPLPKMIIFSAMPYKQTQEYSFTKCMSKTGLYTRGFKIKEFTIFLDEEAAYRSPYTTAFQHYINFMKAKNGQWETSKISDGGQDYFVFRDQSWMIPITFDDAAGKSAVVKVKIVFENILEEQYDLLVMTLPYHELHLNSETKEDKKRRRFLSSKKPPPSDAESSSAQQQQRPPPPPPPEVNSNFYEMVLVGINWSRYLKTIYPKIPTTLCREKWKEIGTVDAGELKTKFGIEPKRSILPEIERFLNIDLFLLYGGKHSPLGISYRPQRSGGGGGGGGVSVSNVFDSLERHTDDARHTVVLQSARAYFHTFGPFHVIPTRPVAEELDQDWISIWRAVVRFKFPSYKTKSQQNERIEFVKKELGISNNTKFTIGDGVFRRLKSRFDVTVVLYVGNIINDNCASRRCFYSTLGNNRLHLLVASYEPDKFYKEFKKFTNIGYEEIEAEPWRNPVLAARPKHVIDRLAAEAAAAAGATTADDADRNARAAGLFDLESDSSDEDDDDDAGEETFNLLPDNNPFLDNEAESDEELTQAVYSDAYQSSFKPIRNLAGLIPNVFDNNTRVKILSEADVKDMPICPTKNCSYSHEKASYMKAHIRNCSKEQKRVIKQVVRGADINDFVEEIVEDKYLPSVSFSQDFFCVFDIECLMTSAGLQEDPNDDNNTAADNEQYEELVRKIRTQIGSTENNNNDDKLFHSLATIASMTSDGKQQGFERKDMSQKSAEVLTAEYLKYLTVIRQDMIMETIPPCVHAGIDHYSFQIYDKEERKKHTIEERTRIRKKLNYLRDFLKLKIYSWCGETYDLRILYPDLAWAMCGFENNNPDKINIIKRDGGYMMLEGAGLSFRDFKNYTCPMRLQDLAKSNGLNVKDFEKGQFPYEWYKSIDQLKRAKNLPSYISFYSTLDQKTSVHAEEINKTLKTKIENGSWSPDPSAITYNLVEYLGLETLTWDPVIEDDSKYGDGVDVAYKFIEKMDKLFTLDEVTGSYSCDPKCPKVQSFFRFCPNKYRDSVDLFESLGNGASMLDFLLDYNFNDVRLLAASINAYASKYKQLFGLGMHSDMSIAQMAQKISFMMYDKDCPPIYSCPPYAKQFYFDCREKLSGGICQAMHRAINLNGPSESIPKSAWQAPNGKPWKRCTMQDFSSLYPEILRQNLPIGPGLYYVKNVARNTFRCINLFNQK
ncbi:unnamed protein product, partial [Oikopleura dioica]